MHRLQELVRLHRQGHGPRRIAELLGMGPNTERRYRELLEPHGVLDGDPAELPTVEELRALVGKPDVPPSAASSVEPFLAKITKLWEGGAGPTAIYGRLKLDDSDFEGSVSAVKRMCVRLRRERGPREDEVVIPVEPVLGEAQVDFGEVGRFFDAASGRIRRTYVFVMTLSGSGRVFARLVHDQKIETWLGLHMAAFRELGSVPRTIVPDNLKSAVTKAAFGCSDVPHLNRSYRELARHYGFVVDPTPPFAPKKKGRVEASVKYIKRSWAATLDEVDFEAAKLDLQRWVNEHANQRVLRRTGDKACDYFDDIERGEMLPLPAEKYAPVVWAKAKVHRDSHISFRKRVYSVPWRLVGRQVSVRATPTSVEIYWEETRVATHVREHNKYRVTDDNHLPDRRVALRHRSRDYWEKRAAQLGPSALDLVKAVFDSDHELSQLRQVQGIVTLLEQYPPSRIESACRRALFFGLTKYRGLKQMLNNADDLLPLPQVAVTSETTGGYRHARSVAEMLEQPLEHTDDPN